MRAFNCVHGLLPAFHVYFVLHIFTPVAISSMLGDGRNGQEAKAAAL
jgi:hypothetical protein